MLALFVLAWLVSRAAGRLATFVVDRSERKHPQGIEDTGVIASLKQRETAISLARTSVRFLAYTLAALLSLGVLLGADKVETIAGASFVVILLAFAAQRFLVDVIAGLLMFHERWFQIGDTIVIEPWGRGSGRGRDAADGHGAERRRRRDPGLQLRGQGRSRRPARLPTGRRRALRDGRERGKRARAPGRRHRPQGADPLHPAARGRRDRPAGGRPAPHPRCGGRARRPGVAGRGPPPEPRPRTSAGRAPRARPGGHVGRRARRAPFRPRYAHPLTARQSGARFSA
jgi:hypothetical protein